ASGFEAFTTAYERMNADRGSVFIVGGTESMSRLPLLFQNLTAQKFAGVAKAKTTAQKIAAMTEFRPADFEPPATLKLGLTDPVCGLNMGETADLLAREDGITREQQDAFALQSHQKAIAAEARLAEEICPIYIGSKSLLKDNGPRPDTSIAALGGL